ncbi:mechanosensitive ion channel [Marnyiella aurantia]|uniref:Mechanosensitive ion channel n=1 Tax=Marnyiella aurantia TaxID=2758037 RepID=A0A7D7LMA9_9FLAO|nr:mechanosensitive ion channel domain-containing protein [Marnyiella aurantia]MBA5246348.1 mechanosensitive ion channel [Marnyiella aurantia]QMS98282.1 mechanosensitive ion channel [Marnyiella aurantia]
MKEEIQQTKTLLADLVLTIHRFIAENISDQWEVQVLIKFLMLFGIVFTLDLLIKIILLPIFSSYRDGEKYPFFKAVHTSGITRSVANIIALLLGNILFTAFFSVYHKETFSILHRVYNVVAIVAVARMGLRALKAVENYFFYKKDYYKIVALKAISETLKTIGIFIFIVVLISVIFGIQGTTILGSLGAITAVLVLVFRDTILGFMTSLHVATSKNLKVGDWIGIPKYNLEGTIEEINLLTTKIENFDKTKSTIPTYDLLSTEIKNMQVMSESNTRRIKRSISFNIKSFRFLSPEDIEKFSKINLVADYLKLKKEEIAAERAGLQNSDLLINGRQLTNIGVFREYTFNYLKNSAHIDQEGTLMVRQLENTPQGLPLEIYCFTNNSVWTNYEEIQSDIFDHLLVASREFDLEVMQFNKI